MPRFLTENKWAPNATLQSLSNAMDVSRPNNWPRVQYMLDNNWFERQHFYSKSIDDEQTKSVMVNLFEQGYLAEPHTAIAYQGLQKERSNNEIGIF